MLERRRMMMEEWAGYCESIAAQAFPAAQRFVQDARPRSSTGPKRVISAQHWLQPQLQVTKHTGFYPNPYRQAVGLLAYLYSLRSVHLFGRCSGIGWYSSVYTRHVDK